MCFVVQDCQYHVVCRVMASWGRQIKHHRILILVKVDLKEIQQWGYRFKRKNKVHHISFLEQSSYLAVRARCKFAFINYLLIIEVHSRQKTYKHPLQHLQEFLFWAYYFRITLNPRTYISFVIHSASFLLYNILIRWF